MSLKRPRTAAAQRYLLSCESPKDFFELRRGLTEAHQPSNTHERILVEEFANAYWELLRVRRIDKEFWEYLGGHYNRGEAGIAEALAQEKETKFRTHLRCRAQAERSYYRALAALDHLHRDRDHMSGEAPGRCPAVVREMAATAPAGLPTDLREPAESSAPALESSPGSRQPLQLVPPRTSAPPDYNPPLRAAPPGARRDPTRSSSPASG
jgi:hypothetical protein